MNRYEKINNSEYIYKNIRLFYANSNEKIFKDVLDNFTRNILSDILFNISIENLKDLIKCRETWEYLKTDVSKNYTSFRFTNIVKETNKDFSKIINENTQKFLNSDSLCDVIEDIIY